MDLLIWVVACFLPDLRCDLLYPTGRPSLTGSDGAVTLSCSAEWCITGTRAHSHGVCFICYNNIGAALAYLIYSLDPLRGLQSAHFQADNGGFTIKTSPCFDVLIAHYCYLDLAPGSRGRHLPAVSLLNACFLNKGLRDFGTEKGSAFRLESWMERLNQVCFCPDPHMRLDSGNWFNRHVDVQKNTLHLGPKLRRALGVDQFGCLLQHMTDLEVCCSLSDKRLEENSPDLGQVGAD